MKVKYNLKKKEKNTRARLGTIETNYGTIKKKKSKDIYNLNFEFIKKS